MPEINVDTKAEDVVEAIWSVCEKYENNLSDPMEEIRQICDDWGNKDART